ncbi:helix-turn-helix domain-containing protein [Burkholderia contaminans]|uniref:helix-turn-helix domain-containing protein n=1 Tax=Burkholderia contaminans TaxID=488447 RepID=UPI0038558525
MYGAGEKVSKVCQEFGVTRGTVYRYLHKHGSSRKRSETSKKRPCQESTRPNLLLRSRELKNTMQATLLSEARPSPVVRSSDEGDTSTPRRKRNVGQPQQLELVLADMVDVAPKDDLASMEIPFTPSRRTRTRRRGCISVGTAPSGLSRPARARQRSSTRI